MDLANEIKRMIALEIQSYEKTKNKTMLCKVVNTDGFLVEVSLLDVNCNEIEGLKTLKNIPIMQGRNIQPCLKKDDIGVLISIDANISNYIFDIEITPYFYGNFQFFIPILALKEFASNAEDFLIKSNLNNSNVTINDTNIVLLSQEQKSEDEQQNQGNDDELKSEMVIDKENINFSTTNISETAKGTVSITSEKAYNVTTKDSITMSSEKAYNVTTKDKYELTSDGNQTITSKGNIQIESKGNLSIKGSSPVEIGNNVGSLKACFDAVFQAMDLIASGMTGTATNPAAYQGGKSALQMQINNIVK